MALGQERLRQIEEEQKALKHHASDAKAANQVRPDKIRRHLNVGLIHAIKMIRNDSGCSLRQAKLRAEHVRDLPDPHTV